MKRLMIALTATATLALTTAAFANTAPNRGMTLTRPHNPQPRTPYALTGQHAAPTKVVVERRFHPHHLSRLIQRVVPVDHSMH